jgi:two-component system nitrogen regulation response regulator GlnG
MPDKPTHDHHILIVEDDYAFRWTLAVRLQRSGVDTDVAENVRDAHELLGKVRDYCCIVVDLKLGGQSGQSVLESIEAAAPNVPVLVVTAYPDAWTRLSESKAVTQVSRVMIKPIDVDLVAEEALRHCATPSASVAFG